MDPVSLVLNALTSGAAQGVANSVSDAVKSAYGKLKLLVSAKLSGNKSAEVALAKHATDPETWQAPLAKALVASGVGADQALIEAARQLMALLDPAGTEQGKYQVDLSGAQGVQVGDGNQQFNTFNSVMPAIMMAPLAAGIQPGQPRNEAAFGPAFEAAGGRARLGRALDEAYEDGPGWVQHFDGGSSGQPAVICALYEHEAAAVAQAVWNVLAQFGRGTYVSGTAAVGFPIASAGRPFVVGDGSPVELAGGKWGRGRLLHDIEAFLVTVPKTHKRLTALLQYLGFARSQKIILTDPIRELTTEATRTSLTRRSPSVTSGNCSAAGLPVPTGRSRATYRQVHVSAETACEILHKTSLRKRLGRGGQEYDDPG